MRERIFNLYLHITDGVVHMLGAVGYDSKGTDQEKLAFLQSRASVDYETARQYPVPERYVLVVPNGESTGTLSYHVFQGMVRAGQHLDVFEEVLQDLRAPADPLVCITPIVDGVPRVEGIDRI